MITFRQSNAAKIVSSVLASTLCISLVPFLANQKSVKADTLKNETNTMLGVEHMAKPVAPGIKGIETDPWTGSFVYFGKYNGIPIKFRVLDPESTKYKSETILLDCDSVLFEELFDDCGVERPHGPVVVPQSDESEVTPYPHCIGTETNDWSKCSLNSYINGAGFLDKDGVFTDIEKASIAKSYQDSGKITTDLYTYVTQWSDEPVSDTFYLDGRRYFEDIAPLNGEKIFLLDMDDVLNMDYGYFYGVGDNHFDNLLIQSRVKSYLEESSDHTWLHEYARYYLRTAEVPFDYEELYGSPKPANLFDPPEFCIVSIYGWLAAASAESNHMSFGVSPALNIDRNTILFSTAISGALGEVNAEYKLTFLDTELKVNASATLSGNTVTVPYSISGSNAGKASQVSVLITDKSYDALDAEILYYNKLNTSEDFSTSGTGTFTVPEGTVSGTCGVSYHVYIIAEDSNGDFESDYASTPFEVTVNLPTASEEETQNPNEDNPTTTPTQENPSEETPTVTPDPTATPEPTEEPKDFSAFVERLYNIALDRESESDGKTFWVDHVKNGELSGADCAREFLNSAEFNDRNLSDEDFLNVLYQVFFDRDPQNDPSGYNFWLNSLKTESRYAVVNGFINSTEWCNVCASYGVRSGATTAKATVASKNSIEFVERLYTTCLGRNADKEGLDYWSLGLTNLELTGTQAVREFVYSREFQDQNFSDEEYLTRLYKTFMDREPDTDGMSYWVNLLSSGTSRNEVFDSFARSAEFAEICNSYAIHR